MNAATTPRIVRHARYILTVLSLVALVLVVLPTANLPVVAASHAAAESATSSTKNGGSLSGCTGQSCSNATSTCDKATGQGLLNGTPLYAAPFPRCYPIAGGTTSIPGSGKVCQVAELVWRFYGTGDPNSTSDVVDSYSVSEVNPQDYCDTWGSTVFSPDPSDAGTAAALSKYDQTPGTAWCESGVARDTTYGGNEKESCLGVSQYTFEPYHVDSYGDDTTMSPIAVVDNNNQSCVTEETAPAGTGPVGALLSNTTTINNPFGSGTTTVANAVKEALVGTKSELGGKDSTYTYWNGLANVSNRMAASVVNDQSATDPSVPLPTTSSLHYGDGLPCSSGLDYTTTTSAEKNFGVCTVRVMRLVDPATNADGTYWALPLYASSTSNPNVYVPAGARFSDPHVTPGNTSADPVPTWRKIIENNVLSNRIGSGNDATGAGAAYIFPYQAYPGNNAAATSPDNITAASQASSEAQCAWGTGGEEITGSTSSTSIAEPAATLPPANAEVQITIQSDPQYGATGGTLHPNVFTATATGLVCPNPTTGVYEDCDTLYPGQYTLNSFSWQLNVTSNSPNYKACPTQTSSGCQFYVQSPIAGANDTSTATAYFYAATQPGETLSVGVTNVTGSYTINALSSATSSTGSTKNTITLCGDGVFNGEQDGISALACNAGSGGITFTTPATSTSSTTTTTKVTTTTKPATATTTTKVTTTYSCPSGYTLSGTSCTRDASVSAATCKANGDTETGGKCVVTIAATKSTSTSSSGSGSSSKSTTTTTTLPPPKTIGFSSANVPVTGTRTITVLGASAVPGS